MKPIVVASILLACWCTSVWARDVNIVLKDKRLINGELIGISQGMIYLKAGSAAESISLESVSEIFDAASGERINPNVAPDQTPRTAPPQVQPASSVPAPQVKPMMFFYGTLDSGWVGFVPCRPLEEAYMPGFAYIIGPKPYDSAWGMGLGLEYRVMKSVAGGIDFGISRWEKLLAKQGGYGVGSWVWEQNGYLEARVGPFPMDVKYYMDTVYLRLGAKYYPFTGMIQPFIGAALGLYAWQAVIGNREEEKKYSEISSDVSISATYQVGVDFIFGDFVLRLFADGASAVAKPRFENLFRDGWTFENAGGEHVQGPYRFGAALGMSY